jgi:hypothetical protein
VAINVRKISLIITLAALLIIITGYAPTATANASSKSPYESGYDHGCDDADISDPDERYINQPEKGPSFYTNEFMRGYNTGYDSWAGEMDGMIVVIILDTTTGKTVHSMMERMIIAEMKKAEMMHITMDS